MTSTVPTIVSDSHDTWGIPGPIFVILYGLVAVALLGAHFALTYWAKGRDEPDERLFDGLAPEEIALLTREEAAIASALATLLAAGAWSSEHTEQPQPDVDRPLPRALLNAYSTGRVHTYAEFKNDPGVRAALDVAWNDLRTRGLLVPVHKEPPLQWSYLPFLAMTLLGLVRTIAGFLNDKPSVFILGGAIFMGVFTVSLFVERHDRNIPTKAAMATLRTLRKEQRDLHPDIVASFRAAPKAARAVAPLSVALFGTGALVHGYPQLASTLDIPKDVFCPMPTDSTFWGGSGGGGGGGCGGGGCGG